MPTRFTLLVGGGWILRTAPADRAEFALATGPINATRDERRIGRRRFRFRFFRCGAHAAPFVRGVPLGIADYDLRTPLHLAAAEGHLKVVEYFIAQGVELNPRDRWGNTPLDDAFRHGKKKVAKLLKNKGGQQGGVERLAVCAD